MKMLIHDLAKQAGVPAKTIRYYESIKLLPRPKRAANNYREYALVEAERLRFIASARSLGFSLADVAEILAARDNGSAPCQRVLDAVDRRLTDVDRRIADLLTLRDSLRQLQSEGAILPRDDVQGEHCVCYLLKAYRDTGHVTIQRGEFFDD
jgi:DNA-binding transcriptional MerR regulator